MDHVTDSQVLACSEVLICDNSDLSVVASTATTKTTSTTTAAIAAATSQTSQSNLNCSSGYVNQNPDYLGSTVERMPATPTPPSSPPGKRKPKTLILEMSLPDIVAKNFVKSDTSTSSSSSCYMDNLAQVVQPKSSSPNGSLHFREQQHDYLSLTGHSTPSLSLTPSPSPQTPSLSSTNASTTPSSALHTSVSLTSNSSINNCHSKSSRSNSLAAAVTTAAQTVRTTRHGLTPEQLLKWQDMPHYLQFNPYVLRGYRPLQTFQGCLLSLFYWHNETINILTHALPIIYILAIVPGLMPWDKGYKFLSFCHLFGSVAPWCGSFVYHLFMNIEQGENVYYTLLKLDMIGIWVSQSFGALPLVTATTLCFTPILKWFIIIAYCVLSLWGLYKALTATSPWQRRLCFGLPFAMRSVLTFLRIRGFVGGSQLALSHVFLQFEVDGVSILGGAIGAMRIPEKWFPGLVDFYLNSHNIMHVLVVVAVYSMHKATIKDFEWMSTQTCNSYANSTVEPLAEPAFENHVEL